MEQITFLLSWLATRKTYLVQLSIKLFLGLTTISKCGRAFDKSWQHQRKFKGLTGKEPGAAVRDARMLTTVFGCTHRNLIF